MKLCHNVREHDSIVRVGGHKYHFRKDDDTDGKLVADVAEDHAVVLLRDPTFSYFVAPTAAPDEEVVDEPAAPVVPTAKYENATFDELREHFFQRFGRKAPPLMRYETMLERLMKDDAARAP